jgi:hypothetical protein
MGWQTTVSVLMYVLGALRPTAFVDDGKQCRVRMVDLMETIEEAHGVCFENLDLVLIPKISTQSRKGSINCFHRLIEMYESNRCFGCYLVDPASSHMLVSKIKPCMSKYKLIIL